MDAGLLAPTRGTVLGACSRSHASMTRWMDASCRPATASAASSGRPDGAASGA